MPAILSVALPATPKGDKRFTYLMEWRLFNGMMRRKKNCQMFQQCSLSMELLLPAILGEAYPLPTTPKR